MNCPEVRDRMIGFLEDSLEESVWVNMREHLEECPACHDLSLTRMSLAADLKKLNNLSFPESVSSEISRAVQTAQPQFVAKKSMAWLAWGLGGIVVFVLAGTLLKATLKFAATRPAKPASVQKPVENKVMAAAEPEALRQLKAIAKSLGVGESSEKHVSLGKEVNLKPFHWHLIFDSEEAKNAFMARVSQMQADVSFRSPVFSVLLVNRPQISEMSRWVSEMKIRMDGALAGDKLPEFNGTVRLSLLLQVGEPEKFLAIFQHWHFYFDLPNRYGLLEKMQAAGIRLVYESPEVWIMEIPPSKLTALEELIRFYPGLKADFGRRGIMPDSDDVTIRTSIYLIER